MHASFPFGAGEGHLVLCKPAASGVEKEEYILRNFTLPRIKRDQARWPDKDGSAFMLDGKRETLDAIENLKKEFVDLDCTARPSYPNYLSPPTNRRLHK